MALDGIFLRHIKKEIQQIALNSRISQIHQPSKDELIISLRTQKSGNKKLLLSAKANSPRVHFTDNPPENPNVPPMFCMLLRKKLSGAKLVDVKQPQLERILFFEFESTNEIGDFEQLTLVTEIMGKYSNVILINNQNIIIDSLKRVDLTVSSLRMVLPGLKYELPPEQDKLNILETDLQVIEQEIRHESERTELNKAILNKVQGTSPIISREIEHNVNCGIPMINALESLQKIVLEASGTPVVLEDNNGKVFDISFLETEQYKGAAKLNFHESFCSLLDNYYTKKDNFERMKMKSRDISKILSNATERLTKKINLQQKDLKKCKEREHLRIKADLLQANLYRIAKGADFVEVENFYDENNTVLRINLNPALTAAQNSQKLYKDYQKAKTAEVMLTEQISKAANELEYIESVKFELENAENLTELAQIRAELADEGYIKKAKADKTKRKEKALPFLEFTSSEGFLILAGKNNKQNDMLTLKHAEKNDYWFHTKQIHGTHVIVKTNGKKITETAILNAAKIAAYYSKAKESSKVPVDYTLIKNVKKPSGAKPGMVIYDNFKTVYVTPEILKQI